MMNAILLSLIAALLIGAQSSTANEPKKSEQEKLITLTEKVSLTQFARPTAADGEASYGKPLPRTENGIKRWDVSETLREQGIEMGPGSEAILLEDSRDLVVTNTLKQIELVERMIMLVDDFGPTQLIDIGASAWEYEAPPAFELRKPLRFAELKKAAGDSLRQLGSISLHTRSGNRSRNVSKEAGTGSEPQPSPKLDAANKHPDDLSLDEVLGKGLGMVIEAEPVIGPDGVTVDLQIGYLARLPRGEGLPNIEISQVTNTAVVDKQDVVIYSTTAPSKVQGKLQDIALVLTARIFDADARPVDQREPEKKPERPPGDPEIIKRARAGLPEKKQ
jgi:hypothetical protein